MFILIQSCFKIVQRQVKNLPLIYVFPELSFLILKIALKIPLKSLGLLITTIFIKSLLSVFAKNCERDDGNCQHGNDKRRGAKI